MLTWTHNSNRKILTADFWMRTKRCEHDGRRSPDNFQQVNRSVNQHTRPFDFQLSWIQILIQPAQLSQTLPAVPFFLLFTAEPTAALQSFKNGVAFGKPRIKPRWLSVCLVRFGAATRFPARRNFSRGERRGEERGGRG